MSGRVACPVTGLEVCPLADQEPQRLNLSRRRGGVAGRPVARIPLIHGEATREGGFDADDIAGFCEPPDIVWVGCCCCGHAAARQAAADLREHPGTAARGQTGTAGATSE